MRNASAVLALFAALLALAVLAAAVAAARGIDPLPEATWLEASIVVPGVFVLALLALVLAARARTLHQLTLGRAGGALLASAARGLAFLALLLAASATVALAVFGVLVVTDGLTRAPW